MSDPKRYDEDEISEILELATTAEGTVQPGTRGSGEGLTLEQIQESGSEVGITPARLADAARAICLEHELGSLAPRMLADLIVVDGDPLQHMQDSRRVLYTMVNGRLYDALTLEQLEPEQRPLPPGPQLDTSRNRR